MARETVYNVTARYRAETGQATSQLRGLNRQTNQLSDNARRAKRMLGGVGMAIKTALGGALAVGIGMGVRRMGQLTTAANEARASLASIFTLNDLGDFNSNLGRASKLIKDFRRAAKGTKGTGADIRDLVSTTMPALAGFDPSDQELVKFGQRTLAASNVMLGSDHQLAGQQMLQMMSGQGGADNRLFNALKGPLFKQLGITETGTAATQQFNQIAQQDPRKLFDAINAALTQLDEANKLLGDTLSGQWATFTDNIDGGLRAAAGPVFDYLREQLKGVNQWFARNEDKVKSIGRAIGNGMTAGLKLAASAAKLLADNLALAMTAAAGLSVYSGAQMAGGLASLLSAGGMTGRVKAAASGVLSTSGKVGSKIGGAARNPLGSLLGFAGDFMMGGALDGVFGASGGGLGAKLRRKKAPGIISKMAGGLTGGIKTIGRVGMSNPAVAIDALESKRKKAGGMLPMMMGGTKGMFAKAGGALMPLVSSLGSFMSVAAPLAVAVMAVVGAFRVLQDDSKLVTKVFYEAVDGLLDQLDMLAQKFGADGVTDLFWELTDSLGAGLVWALTFVTTAIGKVVEGFNWLGFVLQALAGTIGEMVMQYQGAGGGLKGLAALDAGAAFNKGLAFAEEQKRRQEANAKERREQRREDRKQKDREKNAKGGPEKSEVKVELVQHNYEATNPDRIAYKSMELMSDAFQNKRLSTRTARSGAK